MNYLSGYSQTLRGAAAPQRDGSRTTSVCSGHRRLGRWTSSLSQPFSYNENRLALRLILALANDDELTGLQSELDFLREGIRQSQRERYIFLGFAIASAGTALGLLVGTDRELDAGENFFLTALPGLILIATALLTIRSTIGITSASAYIRTFLEPRLPGMNYETRLAKFTPHAPYSTGAALGLGIAYVGLTAAVPFTYFGLVDKRTCVGSVAIILITMVSAILSGIIAIPGLRRPFEDRVRRAWETVQTEESPN